MFIVDLTYKVELDIINKYLASHIEFLEKHLYNRDGFITSGRKNPRSGGIIIIDNITYDEINKIIKLDPFYTENIVNFTITEFIPKNEILRGNNVIT